MAFGRQRRCTGLRPSTRSAHASVVVSRSHVVRRTPRPDVVDGDPVHRTGGRAFTILRVLRCSAASTATATSSCSRWTSAGRECVSTRAAATSPRHSGRRGRSPTLRLRCHRAGAAARCARVLIDHAGDPAVDDGEADRHQADHPVAADRAQPGDSCSLQSAGDPRLVHGSIIAAPIGRACASRAESVLSSNVGSRFEVVLEGWRCRRPAQDLTSAAVTIWRGSIGAAGDVRREPSVQFQIGGVALVNRSLTIRSWTLEHGWTWPAVPPGDRAGSCGWVVAQTRPKRSRISVWISSYDSVASMRATNSLR